MRAVVISCKAAWRAALRQSHRGGDVTCSPRAVIVASSIDGQSVEPSDSHAAAAAAAASVVIAAQHDGVLTTASLQLLSSSV